MSFKDCIASDIKSVFINADEFADTHNINGEECTCILQDVTSAEDITIDKKGNYYPYVYGASKVLNVAKDDLTEVPVYGQTLEVDGELYSVENVADDMGILTITLMDNAR